jgi:hypothetical protein
LKTLTRCCPRVEALEVMTLLSGAAPVASTATDPTPLQVVSVTLTQPTPNNAIFTVKFNELVSSTTGGASEFRPDTPDPFYLLEGVKKGGKTVFTKDLGSFAATDDYGGPPTQNVSVSLGLVHSFRGTVELRIQGAITTADGVSNNISYSQVFKHLKYHYINYEGTQYS